MKILLIQLMVLGFCSSFGQIEGRLNAILLKRDYNGLVAFIDKYHKEQDSIKIQHSNRREIIKGFEETVFYIHKSYPGSLHPSITSESVLKLITRQNQVVYFYLEVKKMEVTLQSIVTVVDTVYRFSDNKNMLHLHQGFKETFKAPMDEKDLFVDTIAVGNKCGHWPGETTSQRLQIIEWVLAKDTASLYRWLQSPNVEKQIYAAIGFFQLSKRGMKPGDKARSLILAVSKKKGTAYTCIPCGLEQTDIADAIKPYVL